MDRGLDELIEFLLAEIAFSGSRGCSDQDFIKAIDSFYGITESGSRSSTNNTEPTGVSNVAQEERGPSLDDGVANDASEHDLGLAAKVWGWLVARDDVSVGTNREFNHLPFKDYLHLCERERASRSTLDPEVATSQEAQSNTGGPRPDTDKAPRLYVSEQRQWKALAGHGPDFKRIPLFEWRALVDIASVKEKGILQGDLVRLTGQDKRSLPTRTDALARKGYIIKQPILLRGFRSSKLWLKQYAESAQAEARREGLPLEELDLSKEALMKDLNPVPFTEYWNGDRLDYLAIAQGFIAITKAWGIIRYCDLRAKMGLEERISQMRALAKSSRWFTKLGAVTFVAARFANSNRLFKDCVKFLREPTPSEWKRFRSIPSRHIKAPSSRLGKRGQASRDHAKLKATQAKADEDSGQAKIPPTKGISEFSDQMVVTSASWIPQKPFVNTVFDVIRRAGPEGTSNNEVRHLTLGYSYRKFIASTNASLASPLVQATHPEYQVTSQLSRIGKIMTYHFFAPGSTGTGSQEAAMDKNQDQQAGQAEATSMALAKPSQEFSQPSSKFVANSSISLSELCKKAPSSTKSTTTTGLIGYRSGQSSRKREPKRPKGRPRKAQEASQTEPGLKAQSHAMSRAVDDQVTPAPSLSKRQRGNTEDAGLPADDHEYLDIQSSTGNAAAIGGETRPLALPDAPGVYRGVANSLAPYKKHGRPPKSIVLIFKSEKVKDPKFLGATGTKGLGTGVVGEEDPDQPSSVSVPISSTPGPRVGDASSTPHKQDPVPSHLVVPKKGPRSGFKTRFKCDMCGRTWKNSNGLEYHKSKSQTPCNPVFAEAPPRPKPLPIPFQTRKVRQDKVILATPSRRQSSRRSIDRVIEIDREHPSSKHVAQNEDPNVSIISTPPKLEDLGRSLLLQDVEVYNVASRQRERSPSASGPATDTTSQPPRQYQGSSEEEPGIQPGGSKHTEHQRHEPSVAPYKIQPSQSGRSQKRDRESPSDPHHGCEDASFDLPRKRQKTGEASRPVNDKQSERQPITVERDDLTAETPILAVPGTIASPPSITRLSNVDFSLRPTSESHSSERGVQQATTGASQVPRQSSAVPGEAANGQLMTPSKGNSQVKVTKVKGVSALVQDLLSDNDGVFPGDMSLLIVVASRWDKEFVDLKTPDRRTIQFAVNKLESQGQIKRLHFLFLDEKGDSQKITVVVSVSPGKSGAEELAVDPRVLKVKDKIREAHPNVYIPESIIMSQDDFDKYRVLMLKPKEKPKKNAEPSPREIPQQMSIPAHEIEMMHYRRPVLLDTGSMSENPRRNSITGEVIPPSTPDPSREEVRDAAAAPLPPLGNKNLKARGTRKGQKKVSAYAWGRNQKPISTWNQKHSSLQDSATGAWSTPPQILHSQASLDSILSFVRYGRIVQPKPPGRKRKHSSSIASPRKKVFARDTNEPREDDAIVDSDHSTTIPSRMNDSYRGESTAGALDYSEAAPEGDPPNELVGELNAAVRKEEIPAADMQVNSTAHNAQMTAESSSGQGNGPFLPKQFQFMLGTQPITDDSLQTTRFLHRENLPQSVDEIASLPRRGRIKPSKWVDKPLAEFTQRVNAISHWELSADGSRVISSKPVTPGSIYLGLTVDQSKANMQPLTLQWPPETQYTVDNLPEEIKNEIYDDQDAGLSEVDKGNDQPAKTGRKRKDKTNQDDEIESYYIVNRAANREPCAYTTRNLTALPPSQQGRVSKRRPLNDLVGRLGDTAIIAAIIVIKSLLGGVEGTIDYGLLLKLFPEKSFTRLKSFWPKVCKQRKKFVDALTDKFQTSFLEAYEKGELAPIDYENLEDYDWVSLILWTAKLDTHDDIDLPSSRTELEKAYVLEDPEDEVVDWRQTWFDNVAVHVRVEANISRPATIPVSKNRDDDTLTLRARSWIRSLCNTEMGEAGVPHRVLEKLLELGKGDEEETTRIISTVVDRLIRDRIATKGKSKKFGFRLNFNFDRIVDKAANTEKYTQAVAFKSRLDDAFRTDEEMFLPYAADDGSIMAVINMQSHGRIHLEPVDVPDIPFGFEPLNYESRSYPKSYYHWKVKLLPTETYLYDDDMPLLEQVRRAEIPTRGPHGTTPIWVDLLDRVDRRRWVEYVCMMAFALATKGPMTPQSASAILKPVLEPFEARLIMDFLDHLGLLQPSFPGVPGGDGGSAGEWWWLAVGKMVDLKGKGVDVATKNARN